MIAITLILVFIVVLFTTCYPIEGFLYVSRTNSNVRVIVCSVKRNVVVVHYVASRNGKYVPLTNPQNYGLFEFVKTFKRWER